MRKPGTSAQGVAEWPVQLAPSASIDAPLQENGPWIVAVNGVPKARVSSDVARVLNAVDGAMQPAQLAQLLGPAWTPEDVEGIVRQLAHTGIFDGGAQPAQARRVQFRAPLTVQFTLFNPAPLLEAFRPAITAMVRPGGAVVALLLLLSGLVGAFIAGPSMWRVLATPLPLEAYLYVVAAMFVSTLLHELGHGMALTYFGGTPRRIGIMLFYLSPAFFCDVTDGWRLSSKKQRVLVALAGPLVHVALGSIAMTVQAFLPESPIKDAAVLYGMICYAVAVLNLFPFIKLDGYVALMSAVDIPHLRKKSIAALADVVSSRVLGSRRADPSRRNDPSQGLLPWFGLASFVSGIAFMVIGFQRLVPVFLQLGYTGHLVVLGVLCLLLAMALRSVVRFFRAAGRNGSPAWRRILVVLLGAVTVGTLLALVPVRPTSIAGYTYADGQLLIVAPLQGSDQAFEPGDHVTLQSQGMIIHENLGQATLGDQPPSNSLAPLDTIAPIALAGNNLPVLAYPSQLESGINLSYSGRAEVKSQRETSLGEWLWDAAINSPLWPGPSGQATESTRGHQ
ncbi:putative peptide zinc metalloprotease protein [Pseudarthrobacter sp. PvP004]|uniref:daptide biosynthesis intramembrane metalloprotease n=1 Tax=Pseudarthrobacter sp. PvP004 TaxID=2817850 RepID=UPI001AE49932|nr:daptide biosynthesis intramembrane metalloprotease [Pseudarthrobacter sp. PvP004]MBP2268997.1 putative peptide zinc metalloprotease protein [Pseudarthrobacter sp. PvP004]